MSVTQLSVLIDGQLKIAAAVKSS